MKQYIASIILGILVIIGGLTYSTHRLIPEFLYYVFGGVAIVYGIFNLPTDTTDKDNK